MFFLLLSLFRKFLIFSQRSTVKWQNDLVNFFMEVLNLLTTNNLSISHNERISPKFLKKSPKIFKNVSKNPQKSNSPFPSVSAAGLLGPNLVWRLAMKTSAEPQFRWFLFGRQFHLSPHPKCSIPQGKKELIQWIVELTVIFFLIDSIPKFPF